MDIKRKTYSDFDGGSTQIIKRVDFESNEREKTPTLVVLDGADTGKVFKVSMPSMSIGRDANTDICLNDKTISRKHCLLVNSNGTTNLIDLQSSNGTFLNGSQIEREPLKDGDKIKIGTTVLRFEMIDIDVKEYHDKLYKIITFDELTSLFNVKSMTKELEIRVSNIPKSLPFSVLFLDIDHFKDVNDTYGHLTGSKVLSDLGRLILSNIRSVDMGCRYGGEEFVLILSQNRADEAVIVAEKLRKKIKSHIFKTHNNKNLSITVSIGIAEALPNLKDFKELIDNADMAMYKAKKFGRDKSVLFRNGNPPAFAMIEQGDRN